MSQKENTSKFDHWMMILWFSAFGLLILASVFGGLFGGHSHRDLQDSKREFAKEYHSKYLPNQSPAERVKEGTRDET